MPLPLPPTLPGMRMPEPPPPRRAAPGGGGGYGGLPSYAGDAAALAAAQEELAADAALDRSLDALAEQLCAEAVGSQLGGVVKDAVREVVAGILPPPRPRRAPHEKPVYVELLGAVMTEALAEEAAEIVSEALATLAHDYVGQRGAEREFALMLDDVLLGLTSQLSTEQFDALARAPEGGNAKPPFGVGREMATLLKASGSRDADVVPPFSAPIPGQSLAGKGYTRDGSKGYASLEEARAACLEDKNAGGVTFEAEGGAYTLRKGVALQPSASDTLRDGLALQPSAAGVSWLKAQRGLAVAPPDASLFDDSRGRPTREAVLRRLEFRPQRGAGEAPLGAARHTTPKAAAVPGMLGDVAFEARVEVATQQLIDEVVGDYAASSAAAALREARGGAARARETEERALVAEVASQAMLEEMMLERLLQQLASRGEGALLQRASGMLLDEMLANGLCRHALRLARRQSSVRDSLILGSAHRQLANRAMLEEMLAQLQGLSASGLEGERAGETPPETPTESEAELDDEAPT